MLLKLLYLCYLASLVEAGAVDVAAAVTAGLASYVVAASQLLMLLMKRAQPENDIVTTQNGIPY